MRKLPIIITLLSLAFSGVASAVEYKTVSDTKSVDLDPTDIVQIVGRTYDDGYLYMQTIHSDEEVRLRLFHYEKGNIFTGITKVRFPYGSGHFVTLKITKASEINKVGPTSVLVLPENARGNYDLIVESSSDSVTWTPFHSQVVQSDTVKRLFRVRIVHKGQPEAKAKAEEK